ncbi:MAG: LysR family transcriptional regulator [Chloroflexales bacterium]|nr:LysR family transcriptional regulator [Chloroflexales bacterium]
MEIHQLQYFVAIVEAGGFSRAAQRCNVAQPSLSQQIIKLEQELGQQLFERLGRTVLLTDAGKALLPRAQSILAEVQSIKSGIDDALNTGVGRLAVGMIPTLAPFLLPKTIQSFTQRFPAAKLEVVEQTTEMLLKALITFELDVCFISAPISHPLVMLEELFQEPLLMTIPRCHSLARVGKLVVDMLHEEPFIALNEDHCLSQQVNTFCYEQQVNPVVVCRTTHLTTVQSCVTMGLGVSLVPAMLSAVDMSRQCVYRRIADVFPQRTIAAAWHSHRSRSHLLTQFIQCVREANAALEYHIEDDI